MSIRNVDTFFHGEVRITIRYLGYALVLFHRNYTQHCSRRTGYHTMCVFLSTGTMLTEKRGQIPGFVPALLNL